MVEIFEGPDNLRVKYPESCPINGVDDTVGICLVVRFQRLVVEEGQKSDNVERVVAFDFELFLVDILFGDGLAAVVCFDMDYSVEVFEMGMLVFFVENLADLFDLTRYDEVNFGVLRVWT